MYIKVLEEDLLLPQEPMFFAQSLHLGAWPTYQEPITVNAFMTDTPEEVSKKVREAIARYNPILPTLTGDFVTPSGTVWTSNGPNADPTFQTSGPRLVEELQQLLRDLEKSQGDIFDSSPNYPKDCAHQWKSYDGFTDKYDFCEKCDLKR
jgi:hypothetical protein